MAISRYVLNASATLIALAASCFPVAAQRIGGITPFYEFVASLSNAAASDYVGHTGVQSFEAFEEMRRALLDGYRGIVVTHSFAEGNLIFDCVPMLAQPSLRGMTGGIAEPPPRQGNFRNIPNLTSIPAHCDDGTIPMRRVTLDDITQFETLHDFLSKYGAPRSAIGLPQRHLYAEAEQTVPNTGGSSTLSIWAPQLSGGGQLASIAQQWYTAPAVCVMPNCVQTAEVGWINTPKLSPNQLSVLFIYYTADGYNKTGCYNVSAMCKGFVQTNNTITLGGEFQNYSTIGGTTYQTDLAFAFNSGNWWLAVNGTYIGYYPGTLYGAGPMAKGAQRIVFGGETVGTTSFPPMGSGQYGGTANNAYHNDILYFVAGGYKNPSLVTRPTSACYSVKTNGCGSTNPDVDCLLQFGGPGGGKC